MILIIQCILMNIDKNIDIFFINTSVFFFAYTYIQSNKKWESNFKETEVTQLNWGHIAVFKENPQITVTKDNIKLHPEWTILLEGKPLSISQYEEYLEYEEYDEVYEKKYANVRKDRYAALYGAIYLLIGSYISLQKNCNNYFVTTAIFLIYVFFAVVAIKAFSYGIEPLTKVRKKPAKPNFMDE